jgi:hypothetical protein
MMPASCARAARRADVSIMATLRKWQAQPRAWSRRWLVQRSTRKTVEEPTYPTNLFTATWSLLFELLEEHRRDEVMPEEHAHDLGGQMPQRGRRPGQCGVQACAIREAANETSDLVGRKGAHEEVCQGCLCAFGYRAGY